MRCPAAIEPERSTTTEKRSCLSRTIQSGAVEPAEGPGAAGSGAVEAVKPGREMIVSQHESWLRISCWVLPSGSWLLSVQNSVTGSAAGVQVPVGLSVPAAPRLFSMMQKSGPAPVAHSAGNWYWTRASESLTGDCEKATSTVTDDGVLATIRWRSSKDPNLRIASLP